MATTIDYGYAANLEELQSVIENLTNVAQAEFADRNGKKTFDPSIVKLGSMQVRVTLDLDIRDDETVYDLRFNFLSDREAQAERG